MKHFYEYPQHMFAEVLPMRRIFSLYRLLSGATQAIIFLTLCNRNGDDDSDADADDNDDDDDGSGGGLNP